MDRDELRRQMIEKAKKGIHEAYTSEEYALIQAINASIDLTRSYNLLNERLSEWNGLYFPEAKANTLKAAELAVSIASNSIESGTGRKISGEESEVIRAYAGLVKTMQEAINSVDSYIANAAKRIMPNTTYLTDPKIASELLSKAGSMKRLATMPAGTIQLLGAEKALFKHIKFGSKPPKYGVLYKLADITSAQKWQGGRIARAYAAKLAIALHADYFSKNFIADKLKEQLDATVRKIKEAKEPDMPKSHASESIRASYSYNQRSQWNQNDQNAKRSQLMQTDQNSQRKPFNPGQPKNGWNAGNENRKASSENKESQGSRQWPERPQWHGSPEGYAHNEHTYSRHSSYSRYGSKSEQGMHGHDAHNFDKGSYFHSKYSANGRPGRPFNAGTAGKPGNERQNGNGISNKSARAGSTSRNSQKPFWERKMKKGKGKYGRK